MPVKAERIQQPRMPFSPLDALIDSLHEVRKAGRVKPSDTVSTVNARIAAVYLPIVEKIRRAERLSLAEQAEKEPVETWLQHRVDGQTHTARTIGEAVATWLREKEQ